MKYLLALFAATTCYAQTAQVPPAKVTGTAQVNAISAKCMIPKNGGTCSFNFPAYQAPITAATAAVSAPVSLSGLTGTFTCNVGTDSTVILNPDGTKTITGVTCSVVTK